MRTVEQRNREQQLRRAVTSLVTNRMRYLGVQWQKTFDFDNRHSYQKQLPAAGRVFKTRLWNYTRSEAANELLNRFQLFDNQPIFCGRIEALNIGVEIINIQLTRPSLCVRDWCARHFGRVAYREQRTLVVTYRIFRN